MTKEHVIPCIVKSEKRSKTIWAAVGLEKDGLRIIWVWCDISKLHN
jgi:hypothetical protein